MTRHVVAVSGGKDSVAMALRLQETRPHLDFEYITTPVGNELPEFFEHLDRLSSLLGKPIKRLQPMGSGDGLEKIICQQDMIPNFRARFCTRILKIEPAQRYLKAAAPCFHYVGLRHDEANRKGMYDDIEGVTHKHPMREWGWSIQDVWNYLDSKGIKIPERTDCALCFFQRLSDWKRLYKKHPELYRKGEIIEESFGYTFRSPGRDTWPASLQELRKEFDTGKPVKGYTEERQRTLFDCDKEDLCRVCTM